MTSSPISMNEKDLTLAKLGMAASKGSLPDGPVPSFEELALLIEDKLDFKRRDQILSHINSNTALFKQWINLVEIMEQGANVSQPKQQKKTLLNWLTSWQSLAGGAVAATLALVLVWQQPSNELIPSTLTSSPYANNDEMTPSTAASFVSPDIGALAAGIQAALTNTHLSISAKLDLNKAVTKEMTSLPPALYQYYFVLGETLVTIFSQCEGNTSATPTIEMAALFKQRHVIKTESFLSIPQGLAAINTNDTTEVSCKKIERFLLSEFDKRPSNKKNKLHKDK